MRQLLAYSLSPEAVLLRQARLEGPSFFFDFPTGRALTVASIEQATTVFADSSTYLGGAANQAIRVLVGERSTASLDGAEHLERRRLSARSLSAARASEEGARLESILLRELPRDPARPVDLLPLFRRVYLDWLASSLLGPTFHQLPGTRLFLDRLLHFSRAADLPLSAFLTTPRVGRAADAFSRWFPSFEARSPLLESIRSARRDRLVESGALLAHWLEVLTDDTEVADEIVTYVGAGYDSTSAMAAWLLHDVLGSPGLVRRLRESLPGPTPLLAACVRESLRLHPALPVVSRVVARSTQLGDVRLGAGDRIGLPILIWQRSPTHFSEPDQFLPDRWLSEGVRELLPTPPGHAPFGGGARRCPGASFAVVGLERTLATVLNTVDLEVLDPRPKPILRGSILSPEGGLRVRSCPYRRATSFRL